MPVPLEVSDKISNLNDQIANVSRILGKSRDRKKVFEAIYRGKKRVKTKKEIAHMTRLSEIRILQEGGKLAANHIVDPLKIKGQTAYRKIPFFSYHKKEILRLAGNKAKLLAFPTKVNPRPGPNITQITIRYPSKSFDVVQLTIDDIDSFSKIRLVKSEVKLTPIYEKSFKEGIKKIIGEAGTFTDWGGEKNDLYTTRLRVKNRRVVTAVAFKGRGKKGVLKPNMMGKNGDQILRLFQSDADIFVLQYWGQIDQSIYEQMNSFAIQKSALNRKKIYYCIIDGYDTARIVQAYKTFF
jgi:hypothetical protein